MKREPYASKSLLILIAFAVMSISMIPPNTQAKSSASSAKMALPDLGGVERPDGNNGQQLRIYTESSYLRYRELHVSGPNENGEKKYWDRYDLNSTSEVTYGWWWKGRVDIRGTLHDGRGFECAVDVPAWQFFNDELGVECPG